MIADYAIIKLFLFHIMYLLFPGHSFPQLKESDAMFSAEKAPEWKDADCCSRCRTSFGMVQRKVCYL